MFRLATLASLATIAASTVSVNTDFIADYQHIDGSSCSASCGSASDKASDVSISLSSCKYDPSSPEPITITLSYQLNEVVTGGTQTVNLKWNGVTVSDKSVDLCLGGVLANDTAIPCPTQSTLPFKGGSSTTITPPKGAPAGSYVGRQTWNDQNGDQILCLAYILSVSEDHADESMCNQRCDPDDEDSCPSTGCSICKEATGYGRGKFFCAAPLVAVNKNSASPVKGQ